MDEKAEFTAYLYDLLEKKIDEERLGFHCEFCFACQFQTCRLAWPSTDARRIKAIARSFARDAPGR